MATEIIEITRGNQYDRDGYSIEVTDSDLYAWGGIARRMDGTIGLTWGGTYLPSPEDREAVEAAICEVMTTGEDRTITIGRDDPAGPAAAEWRSPRGMTLAEEMDREDSIY